MSINKYQNVVKEYEKKKALEENANKFLHVISVYNDAI